MLTLINIIYAVTQYSRNIIPKTDINNIRIVKYSAIKIMWTEYVVKKIK